MSQSDWDGVLFAVVTISSNLRTHQFNHASLQHCQCTANSSHRSNANRKMKHWPSPEMCTIRQLRQSASRERDVTASLALGPSQCVPVPLRYRLNYPFRLRNDLYCVGWVVKLYLLTHSLVCSFYVQVTRIEPWRARVCVALSAYHREKSTSNKPPDEGLDDHVAPLDLRSAGLAEVARSLKSLITNGPYMFVVLYGTFDAIIVNGVLAFGAKYYQQQFGLSPSMAGIVFGRFRFRLLSCVC